MIPGVPTWRPPWFVLTQIWKRVVPVPLLRNDFYFFSFSKQTRDERSPGAGRENEEWMECSLSKKKREREERSRGDPGESGSGERLRVVSLFLSNIKTFAWSKDGSRLGRSFDWAGGVLLCGGAGGRGVGMGGVSGGGVLLPRTSWGSSETAGILDKKLNTERN